MEVFMTLAFVLFCFRGEYYMAQGKRALQAALSTSVNVVDAGLAAAIRALSENEFETIFKLFEIFQDSAEGLNKNELWQIFVPSHTAGPISPELLLFIMQRNNTPLGEVGVLLSSMEDLIPKYCAARNIPWSSTPTIVAPSRTPPVQLESDAPSGFWSRNFKAMGFSIGRMLKRKYDSDTVLVITVTLVMRQWAQALHNLTISPVADPESYSKIIQFGLTYMTRVLDELPGSRRMLDGFSSVEDGIIGEVNRLKDMLIKLLDQQENNPNFQTLVSQTKLLLDKFCSETCSFYLASTDKDLMPHAGPNIADRFKIDYKTSIGVEGRPPELGSHYVAGKHSGFSLLGHHFFQSTKTTKVTHDSKNPITAIIQKMMAPKATLEFPTQLLASANNSSIILAHLPKVMQDQGLTSDDMTAMGNAAVKACHALELLNWCYAQFSTELEENRNKLLNTGKAQQWVEIVLALAEYMIALDTRLVGTLYFQRIKVVIRSNHEATGIALAAGAKRIHGVKDTRLHIDSEDRLHKQINRGEKNFQLESTTAQLSRTRASWRSTGIQLGNHFTKLVRLIDQHRVTEDAVLDDTEIKLALILAHLSGLEINREKIRPQVWSASTYLQCLMAEIKDFNERNPAEPLNANIFTNKDLEDCFQEVNQRVATAGLAADESLTKIKGLQTQLEELRTDPRPYLIRRVRIDAPATMTEEQLCERFHQAYRATFKGQLGPKRGRFVHAPPENWQAVLNASTADPRSRTAQVLRVIEDHWSQAILTDPIKATGFKNLHEIAYQRSLRVFRSTHEFFKCHRTSQYTDYDVNHMQQHARTSPRSRTAVMMHELETVLQFRR